MQIIEAKKTKFKKEKKIVYSFLYENEEFEASVIYGKKPSLTLLHKGTQIGFIDKSGGKAFLNVDTDKAPVKITAWMMAGGRVIQIGIIIDGKPVQHTVADPNTHIKSGRIGLIIALIINAINSIFQIAIGDMSTAVIFIVPFIILLVLTLAYKKWLTFALIAGIILSVLELAGYLMGIPYNVKNDIYLIQMIYWTALRVITVVLLVEALNWKRNPEKKLAALEKVQVNKTEEKTEKKPCTFLVIILSVVGLIISFAFIVAVGLAKKINELLFLPQLLIFGILFILVFPNIMIPIGNLYFKKKGKKTWGNWFKISESYTGVFTVIAVYQSAFAAIELMVYANISDKDYLFQVAMVLFLILIPSLRMMLIKFAGIKEI